MNGHISIAKFSGGRTAIAQMLYQYDYGQVLQITGLELPTAYEVHFSNHETLGNSITQIGNENGVSIPDQCLQSGNSIYAFIFLHDTESDGETEYKIHIPVKRRPQLSNDVPTPAERSVITQAIAALNSAVEQTGANVERTNVSAQAAAESEGNAEAWSVGKRSGQDVPATDETYQNNAKYYAAVAAQHADSAGYVQFDINDSNGEMYVTVANNLNNDLTFQINDNTGELEVVIL